MNLNPGSIEGNMYILRDFCASVYSDMQHDHILCCFRELESSFFSKQLCCTSNLVQRVAFIKLKDNSIPYH